MTPQQCRLARELLDWSHDDLNARLGVVGGTVAGFEEGRRAPGSRMLLRLRRTFEAAGVEFVGWGLGARLR